MHKTLTEQAEQAYTAGTWAREAGRELSTCPQYGQRDTDAAMRQEWRRGWETTDAYMRPKVAGRKK